MLKILGTCLAVLVLSQASFAGFVLSVSDSSNPSNVFVQNSGVQSIAVNISGAGTGHTTNFLTAQFSIQSPALFQATPGTFGQVGQVGNGNLNIASGFVSISGGAGSLLSLDFNNPNNSITNGQIATLTFDTTGLAIGDYGVSVVSVAADGTGISSTNGSFSITAVPEPSSLALLGVVGLSGVAYRRFRNRKLAAK